MKNSEALKQIFQSLSGYTCRVKAGGLFLQGSIEGETKLEFQEHYGLQLSVPLKWNSVKVQGYVMPVLNDHLFSKENGKADISFDARDQIADELQHQISEAWVQAGTLTLYGAKSYEVSFVSEELYSLKVTYEFGTVELSSLKKL